MPVVYIQRTLYMFGYAQLSATAVGTTKKYTAHAKNYVRRKADDAASTTTGNLSYLTLECVAENIWVT